MTFELTEELMDSILTALENQEEKFLVDAENRTLISAGTVSSDDNFFYSLPEWDSAAGFNLREEFTNNLHASSARKELREALHSGRGVFRTFKIKIKEFPEVEKMWHSFKLRKMRIYIDNWYNELREIWGLEKLELEPEDNDGLIHNDFTFQEFDSEKDLELILHFINADADVLNCSCPEQIKNAVFELWQRQFSYGSAEKQTGFICRTLSNEFAGCITAAPVSERTDETVILTSFFVPEKLRGLGIGTELLMKCLSDLKARGKKWILLTYTIVPDSLQPLLLRSGFEKIGSGFAAKIQ